MSQVVGAREVEVGEFTPCGERGSVVCPRCVFFGSKSSENSIDSINTDPRVRMMRRFLLSIDALVSRLTSLLRSVSSILRLVAGAKIRFDIVEAVSISVIVALFVISLNLAMHVDLAKSSRWKKLFTHRVESFPTLAL